MPPISPPASRTLTVDPRPRYVPTGQEVSPGERYRFAASGKWQDWTRICGPEGWSLAALQWGNRLPGRPFFFLCGAIGRTDEHVFPIGPGLDWTVPAEATRLSDRQLHLFANDWRLFYFNNHSLPPHEGGPLTVTITKLEEERICA